MRNKGILEQKSFLQRFIECCSSHKKERKVNETPMRSLLKTMGFRVIEVLIDTLLLQTINPEIQENLLIAIGIEVICWVLSFIWERIWNRTDFGREVRTKCPHCDKEIKLCSECETKATEPMDRKKRFQELYNHRKARGIKPNLDEIEMIINREEAEAKEQSRGKGND